MAELLKHGQKNTEVYDQLNGWKCDLYSTDGTETQVGKNSLTQAFLARASIQRAGKYYE